MNSLVECEEAVRMMKETSKYIEDIVKSVRPDLLNTFYTYSNEAFEARRLLNQDLSKLNYGDAILEVGAGILALATQLSREGFKVTAVEPVQDGFAEINFIMNQYIMINNDIDVNFELIRSNI
jgi:2-polyprenyl-3-methyl-5-hydroxy-6-metoxy-1,4-benzoquinol methylase